APCPPLEPRGKPAEMEQQADDTGDQDLPEQRAGARIDIGVHRAGAPYVSGPPRATSVLPLAVSMISKEAFKGQDGSLLGNTAPRISARSMSRLSTSGPATWMDAVSPARRSVLSSTTTWPALSKIRSMTAHDRSLESPRNFVLATFSWPVSLAVTPSGPSFWLPGGSGCGLNPLMSSGGPSASAVAAMAPR